MELKECKEVILSSDHRTLLQESQGVRFFPVFSIQLDGKESEFAFHTVLRWERKVLNAGKAKARTAVVGPAMTDGGSWPFLDFHLKKGKDGDSLLTISDQNIILHSAPLILDTWESVYNVSGPFKENKELRCFGREIWKTSTGESENSNKSSDGALLRASWLELFNNIISSLLPEQIRKMIPFRPVDLFPLSYNFRLNGKVAAQMQISMQPVMKSMKVSFDASADEESRFLALAHGVVLLSHISRKIQPPEKVKGVKKKR